MLLADALPADEQLVLLRRLRDRERDMRAYLEQLVIPLAHPIETGSVRLPDAVRRLGADIHLFVADWLDNFIAELEVSEAPN